jgi:hypothetical protein
MLHWLIIILGIFIISLSLSNPFFKIVLKKILILNLYFSVLFRVFLFLIGVIVIFMGLFVESVI